METGRVELLILDFAGVCTPSTDELARGPLNTTIPIRTGLLDIIARAKARRVQVVILSNEISLDWKLSHDLFATVDEVIACSDNGIFKPDRRSFQRCLLATGCNAEQTVVVDDEQDNVTVARSLGMRSVLFDTTDPQASFDEVDTMLS